MYWNRLATIRLWKQFTTIKHLRLLLLLRLYDYQKSVYDYRKRLRLWSAYDYDTNRHKFRCKFIIKLYQRKKLRKKEEKNQKLKNNIKICQIKPKRRQKSILILK